MISVTVTDRSGRTLSGQTIDAFWVSIAHAQAVQRRHQLRARRARHAPVPRGARPDRRLLHQLLSERRAAERVRRVRRAAARHGAATCASSPTSGFVNIVGGCCGTTPEHIAAIAEGGRDGRRGRRGSAPTRVARGQRHCGADVHPVRRARDAHHPARLNFQMIGERTNVTGSARFARLIRAGDYAEAAQVALDQVRGGANLDRRQHGRRHARFRAGDDEFLNYIATEPEIARVPFMVDSSKWSVIEAGLKCVQGKPVVNSISLKEGEADFLQKAAHRPALRRRRRRHGVRRDRARPTRSSGRSRSASARTRC